MNWCWRATCNKCNTAKPASLVTVDEVRDGRGGGFNERFLTHYVHYLLRSYLLKCQVLNQSFLIQTSKGVCCYSRSR